VALGILGLAVGCAAEPDPPMGSMNMDLEIAPGVTIDTVNWTISNPTTGFTRSGSVDVRFSSVLAFQIGGIPAGSGYTISLSAMSVDGEFTCSGSAGFSVSALAITPVSLQLYCSAAPPDEGSVVVTGTTQVCATLSSLGASPLETAVNTSISLSATGSAGTLPVSYTWTATAGTFDNPQSVAPTFTCPATPGPVVISVTVYPSAPSCNTVTTRSVTVTCSAVGPAPTFTNVYTMIIGPRCTDCHRPGGSGVTVGMLDMSTQATAYANLVGVPAQGIGPGTSGIACASAMPPLIRVVPGDAAASLLFNKIYSKHAGIDPLCGSPMPLPPTAPPLTEAEINLIALWINAGAPNN
jgi:hypothetical protein